MFNRSANKYFFAYPAFFFLLGFLITFKVSLEPVELIMADEAPDFLKISFPYDIHVSTASTRLIFVSILEPSWIREALITRTAQSLFPLKNEVVWVIVVPPEKDFPEDLLISRLQRYGVPWVMLKAKKAGNRNARTVATAWALREVPLYNGVLMFSRMRDTYDFRLLKNITLSTKKVSVWPVGLLKPYSSPIVKNGALVGYFLCSSSGGPGSIAKGDVLVEPGSFAVHLNYFRRVDDWTKWMKIEENYPYWLVQDLGVSLNEVTVITPTLIGAWRSQLWELKAFPSDLKIKTLPQEIQSMLSRVIR